ncbi:hypothetical protein QBC36DRAFT_371651 [Triangularia setosa]|uniref:Uncharacterized protein n=1 Tax=Triangularia setosa TaxID=2587417 RepID=A0AAN7A8N6_9PEZI|nr:hypothetical protein QBC36DRAFT_371651 [Podospora setosa]
MDEIEDVVYASSVASFEDVGHHHLTAHPASENKFVDPAKNAQKVEVPEIPKKEEEEDARILYTTVMVSEHGKVTNTRQGKPPSPSKPTIITPSSSLFPSGPVIEIMTTLAIPSRHDKPEAIMNAHRLSYRPYRTPDNLLSAPSPGADTVYDGQLSQQGVWICEEEMAVHSTYLRAALSAIIQYYPGFETIQRGGVLKIAAPYQMLVHHQEELESYKFSQPGGRRGEFAAATAEHIEILLNFLEEHYGTGIPTE